MDLQHDAKQIIDRSLQTVLPDAAVRRALEEHPIDRGATVIAIGKAAWRMARAAQQVLGERLKSGIVITKYGHSEGPLPRMTIFLSLIHISFTAVPFLSAAEAAFF